MPHTVQIRASAGGWSRTISALLSLSIPGAGQLYSGKTVPALLWLPAVVTAYLALPALGVAAHGVCIFDAIERDSDDLLEEDAEIRVSKRAGYAFCAMVFLIVLIGLLQLLGLGPLTVR